LDHHRRFLEWEKAVNDALGEFEIPEGGKKAKLTATKGILASEEDEEEGEGEGEEDEGEEGEGEGDDDGGEGSSVEVGADSSARSKRSGGSSPSGAASGKRPRGNKSIGPIFACRGHTR